MPTYLYKHDVPPVGQETNCEHDYEFEVVQSIKEDALARCPGCNQPVTRLIAGSTGVVWKGGSPTPRHYR